jgi:periplasmic copper chaperone A
MKFAYLIPAIIALAIGAAQAHEYKVGSLEIGHPWTRATPKGATVAGGYLKITNKGTAADRLTAATFTAAPRVEIHEMAMSGTTMQMRPLPNGIEIKPGETVEFKPGSYHIMFMNLKTPLEKGQRVKGTLTFEKAGPVEVEFVVDAVGAQTPGQTPGMSGHNH